MFLRNYWYVAGWQWEVAREALFRRTLLGEPVVLFRDTSGKPQALEDRCSHRQAPLSKGRLVGNDVECPYHGLRFNGAGNCVLVPSQTQIPPEANIRSYPVVEKHHWVWIWMGDPAAADPALIPDYSTLDDPAWAWKGETLHYQGNYQLISDNLLDLAHLTFLHPTTLGTAAVAATPIKAEREGNRVRMTRWVMDSPPAPMQKKAGNFTGNVDRWQVMEFAPPSYYWHSMGAAVAGSGAREGNFSQSIAMKTLIPVTPETETSTFYFRTVCHDYAVDDPSMTELLFRTGHLAMEEDMAIIAAQQQNLGPEKWVDFNQDAAGLQARRIVAALLDDEKRRVRAA